MQTNKLAPKTPRIKTPRVGRGGKRGKTSGRGNKGQKARAGRKMRPELRDLIKKLPKRRGHGKNRSHTVRADRTVYIPVNVSALENAFNTGDTVTPILLVKKGLVATARKRVPSVKLLGTGTLTKSLSVSGLTVSASAKKAIESAGGSVL